MEAKKIISNWCDFKYSSILSEFSDFEIVKRNTNKKLVILLPQSGTVAEKFSKMATKML